MHNNHASAQRLEKVAETFAKLAETYVRVCMVRGDGTGKDMGNAGAGVGSAADGGSQKEGQVLTPSSIPSLGFPLPEASVDIDISDLPPDSIDLLGFLGGSNLRIPVNPADCSIQAFGGQSETGWDEDMWTSKLRSFGEMGGLDEYGGGVSGMFDWFAWDQYECVA
ncbi:hypothetical protein DL98DRAFT_581515 [Cadophora sp. DSE1049]|nr:hypothetical protein DL98DRAFT_581515 [Cadophora sp. DSE1049]